MLTILTDASAIMDSTELAHGTVAQNNIVPAHVHKEVICRKTMTEQPKQILLSCTLR
jgi:hypothetical protein